MTISEDKGRGPITEPSGYLSLTEASLYLRVKERTLREWVYLGKVSAYQPGRRLLFKIRDLETFVQQHATKTAQVRKKLGLV